MKCPYCGEKLSVKNTRHDGDFVIYRSRSCTMCDYKTITKEVLDMGKRGIELSPSMVFAKQELSRWTNNNDPAERAFTDGILDVYRAFVSCRFSGAIAKIAIPLLNRLFKHMPLVPLYGKEDEWGVWCCHNIPVGIPVDSTSMRHNKRFPSIYQIKDGSAYRLQARYFSDDGGKTWYSNHESTVPVTFPYMPEEPEYIQRELAKDDEGAVL